MSAACSKILWIRRLMEKLHIPIDGRTTLHANNNSELKITTNLVHHENTKHIKVDFHYIQKLVVDQVISLRHITSNDQLQTCSQKG